MICPKGKYFLIDLRVCLSPTTASAAGAEAGAIIMVEDSSTEVSLMLRLLLSPEPKIVSVVRFVPGLAFGGITIVRVLLFGLGYFLC